MADQNDVQLQIIARLQDEASAPLAKLTQEVQRFSDAAPRASQGFGSALDAQLDRAEADARRVVETVRTASGLGHSVEIGPRFAEMEAASTKEAQVAASAYLETMRLTSAALTLTNTERTEAVELLRAEAVASAAGARLTEVQRTLIVEEVRARETYSNVLAAQAQRAVAAAQATSDAVMREDVQRRATLATLREDIIARDREGNAKRDAARDAEAYLDALREERRLLGLSSDEREVALAVQRAEALADKLGTKDKAQFVDQIEREVRALQRERGELDKQPRSTGARGSRVLGGLSSLSTIVPGQGLAQITSQAANAAQAVESIGLAAGSSTAALGPFVVVVAAIVADIAAMAVAFKVLEAAFDRSAKLTEALRPIATTSAEGAASIGVLRDQVRGLAADTGRTVEDLGRAASAFRNLAPADRLVALQASARLAQAGLTEAGTAAQALDRVLDAFGESADLAARRTDQLFVASRAGEVGVQEFADGIARLGPLSVQLGVPFEQLADLLAKVTKRTGDASQGAQALSTILAQLSDPASSLATELRGAGVDASAFALQSRGANAVLQDIGAFLERHPDLSTQLFGSPRTSRAAFAALQDSGTATLALMEDQRTAADETSAAIERSATASESLRKIWTRIVDLSGFDKLGDNVEGALRGASTSIEKAQKDAGDARSRFIAEGLRDIVFPFDLPFAFKRAQDRLAAEQKATQEQAARAATEAAASAAAAQARVSMPLVAAAAIEALKASLPAVAALALPFDVRATEESARKTVEAALANLKGSGAVDAELPVLVRAAVEELNKTGLDTASAAARAASVRVINEYANALREALELERSLGDESLVGSAKVDAANERAREATRRKIDALRAEGVEVAGLETAYQLAVVAKDKFDALNREVASDRQSIIEGEALLDQLRSREQILRSRGEEAKADALSVQIAERQNALAIQRFDSETKLARLAAQGSTDEAEAFERSNAARRAALTLERSVLAAVRARAVEDRKRDNLAAIAANRAAVLDGLDGEIAKIREAAKADADRARASIRGAQPDVQSRLASDAEAALALGDRAVRQSIDRAHEFVASSLADLLSQVATTPIEAAAAERVVASAAESRLRAQLVLNKATEEELALFDSLVAKQRELATGSERLAELFGEQDFGRLVVKPEVDLRLDALDAKLREQLEPSLAKLRELFASGADDETLRNAVDDIRERMRNLREEIESVGESFGRTFSAQIADKVTEFGDTTRQAVDAANAFADSFVNNAARALEDFAKGAESAGDAAKEFARGLVADMLAAAAKLASQQLFATIFGGLLGGAPSSGGITGIFQRPAALGGIRMGEVLDTRAFAQGGVATRPSLALFAERPGMAEAFVPLPGPNRGIPVEFKPSAFRGRDRDDRPMQVTIQVTHSPSVQALDARGVQEVLAREATTLADLVAMKLSDGSHAGLRASVARAAR